MEEAGQILQSQNFENKYLYISLSGQLHMQDPGITLDNVMQDSTGFTLFARSNIQFSNLVRQNAQNGLSFDWKFYPRDLHRSQMEKAKMYFEFATEYYPGSANAYDSMSEFYEMQKDYKRALRYAEDAYQISGKPHYLNKIEELKSKL